MSITLPAAPDRRMWITATTVIGGAGLAASAVPFVASLAPSERARALGAPVEVDLLGMTPGGLRTVEWRGKPVFVLMRSRDMLDSLAHDEDLLADPQSRRSLQPEYTRNVPRSARPAFLVLEAVCTHLGCIPNFRPTSAGTPALGAAWPGGFYCPCHGSKFDLAGRVFKGVPAPTNLTVPPYLFVSDSALVIGIDPKT